MKNLILLIIVMFMANYSHAQLVQLSWYKVSPFGNSYTTQDFNICGAAGTKTFKVAYSQCPNLFGVNCIGGCNSGNSIRYTIELQRNGVAISSQTFQASSDWSNTFFYNTSAPAASYRAYVKVERRKRGCIFGWQTVYTGYTNDVVGNTVSATPNFNINGTPLATNGGYILACVDHIKVNAAATSCEPNYYVGVQETNSAGNRTYDYEWGGWINGQAPNNIDLQNLATTFGIGTRYIGNDLNREGNILIGGNLSSGQARYYRVSVCTGVPSWQCKNTLIRVSHDCRIDNSTIIEDTNEYVGLEDDQLAQELRDGNIEVSFEADIAEDITDFETQTTANINIAPNPFSSSTVVSIDNYDGETPILFELYNSLGERVTSMQTNKTQFEIQRNQLSSGIYMYRMTVGNELLGSGKVVIE